MTSKRIITYGYKVEKGKNVLYPQESEIVRRIFTDYLGGASLMKIAQNLTAEKVEFIPGRSDWNKNRIKRILEDERYLGNDTYPAIIGADMYRQARAVKDSNNTQKPKSEQSDRLPCTVECALCGAKMTRRHDSRRKASQEVWTCQNPDCHIIANINDDALQEKITAILNRLIADPSLIESGSDPATLPMEVRRLQNEADLELDSFAFDKDKAQIALFALAREKYRHIDSRQVKSYMARAAFEDNQLSSSEPLSSFMPELFKRTVLKVRLDTDGKVALVLKNHQIIGKGDDHADDDHTNGDDAGSTATD
jgi:ssDNA-binding Zn-finger/Zn-ribbon topoisomerase 1